MLPPAGPCRLPSPRILPAGRSPVSFRLLAIGAPLALLLGGCSREPAAPAPAVPAATSHAPAGTASAPATPAAAPDSVRIERDPAVVFQRAFWRRLDAEVRVLHAERRETLGAHGAPQSWSWFIALETKPDFRRWLFEQNPFELVAAPATELAPVEGAPSWFPASTVRVAMQTWHNRERRFRVFFDASTGRLYATDHGGGLNAPAVPLAAPPR
jgi:hypothetical protein